MNYIIERMVGYISLNKALVRSIFSYHGKQVLILGVATLIIFSPISTAPESHEIAFSVAKAATIEESSRRVWVTAYSSSFEETDDTPFITASGKHVRDGIIAANFLPLYSKVRIPEYFGDKIFIVEDRMHPRKTNFVDIWMPSKYAAIKFGITKTDIIIVERGPETIAKKTGIPIASK